MADAKTETIGERAERELAELVGKCAAAEAEIVTAYFSKPRPRDSHIVYMKHQTGRELSRVFQLGNRLTAKLPGLCTTTDRLDFQEDVQKLLEETVHFNLSFDILMWLLGEEPSIAELRNYDIFNPNPDVPFNRENAKLARLYRELRSELAEETAPWVPLVLDEGLLEGGGCGYFYTASRLEGGEFERRVAEMMKVVVRDELRHGPEQLQKLRRIPLTEQNLERLRRLMKRHAEARVRFRNEEFSYVLGEERLREIIEEGKIEPLYVWQLA